MGSHARESPSEPTGPLYALDGRSQDAQVAHQVATNSIRESYTHSKGILPPGQLEESSALSDAVSGLLIPPSRPPSVSYMTPPAPSKSGVKHLDHTACVLCVHSWGRAAYADNLLS